MPQAQPRCCMATVVASQGGSLSLAAPYTRWVTSPGRKRATENTHWYHCPQNNLFQGKDVSHLGGSGEKFKNIKQIQPKYLEKKKQKWQKLFGGLELRIGFKSCNFWSLSSLLCLNNHFQMTQIGMPMTCSTATFFSLLSWWKSPQSEKTSPGKRWH